MSIKTKPSKPIGRKNYGSIPHIRGSKIGPGDHHIHEGQERIILEKFRDKHDSLFVTEKYDGANVGVCKKDGQIIAIQRKGYNCLSSPYEQHREFAKYVKSNGEFFQNLLHEGWRICGEWLWQTSGIKYKVKKEPFVAFDIFDHNNKRLNYLLFQDLCFLYAFRSARLVHSGVPTDFVSLRSRLNEGTDWAKTIDAKPEGMVFRVERRGQFDFMAKWVRPDFEAGKYLPGIGLPKDAEIQLNIIQK